MPSVGGNEGLDVAVSEPRSHVEDVAAAILDRLGSMDTWKLQKLTYYCQAWHCAWREEPLFPERIEAWSQGPVAPELFQRHRGRYCISSIPGGDPKRLDADAEAIVDYVCGRYGAMTGRELSTLTHHEDPWRITRERVGVQEGERSKVVIPLELLASYYRADREALAQAGFWTAEWRGGEREADADRAQRRSTVYESSEAFLSSL